MSDAPTGGPTLLHPDEMKRAPSSSVGPHSQGLPTDLVTQATSRLQAMALLYAGVFFLAAFFPPLLFEGDRRQVFGNVINWLPGALAIGTALAVATILRLPQLSLNARMAICVVFEITSSYGIAASEFLQPLTFNGSWVGLSWVAVWIMLFTIVIPSTPGRSVMAGLAACSAVPVMVAISNRIFHPGESPNVFYFFFAFVFPYLLVVGMAYVGARVMSALGNEVRKARELGSYRLLERLGQGGMGEVWRARHRLLARPAAIKLIRPSTSSAGISEDARRRFEREAQAIASLRSPHTVDLFDFGVSDDGTFYYVMELLDGLDAERLVKKHGPLPAERVVHVIRQVCHSLSEAESIGLVHRDIKPANIILCRYGEDDDFVKVLDFGIVKAIQEPRRTDAEPTQSALTMEHVVRGTPAFIAPEQALGASAVDNRADIYATGCLAYWLLTGQLVSAATHQCNSSFTMRRRRRTRPHLGRNCRFRQNSTRSCSRAWQKTPPSVRRPRANSRNASMRSRSRTAGPRLARESGGSRTSHKVKSTHADRVSSTPGDREPSRPPWYPRPTGPIQIRSGRLKFASPAPEG